MNFNIANLTLGPVIDRLGYSFNRHHVEHHFFPIMPFFKLPQAADFLQQHYQCYMFPTQTFNFTYMREHVVGSLAHCKLIELAGREFKVSAGFDAVKMSNSMRELNP
jgi:fatty acid desaturase